jgi:hypothetical protein
VAQGSIPFPRDPAGRKVLTLIQESYTQLRKNTPRRTGKAGEHSEEE